MNLLHLYYFCKVAELQHFTKAAAALYISQPSLSGAMSTLEADLGIALFEKNGRNVQLTKYGNIFYQYVRDALQILDEGVAAVKEFTGDTSGSVDIGCISTIMGSYFPKVMTAFHEKYPDIKLNIYVGQTNEIIDAVKSGKFDVGFCTYKAECPNLYFVPVLSQPAVAVVRNDHPLVSRQAISLRELKGETIISYSLNQPIGQQFHTLLCEHGMEGTFSYCTEIIMGGIISQEKIKSGHGKVGLMIYSPELREFQNISAIPIDDIPSDFRLVDMVFDKYRSKIHAVKLFIDFIAAFYSYKYIDKKEIPPC